MLKPVSTILVLKALPVETETESGLFIPVSAQDTVEGIFERGVCIAAGPDAHPDFLNQQVVFAHGTGFPIKEEGEDFILVDAERCFAISHGA